ncbi:MAG: hypothetical protein AAF555_09565 [Verrucomicrobiota bacterium]
MPRKTDPATTTVRPFTMKPNNLPQRKKLPHEIPSWVQPGSAYFLTINATPRGQTQLTESEKSHQVFQSATHHQEAGKWHLHLLLLMPDHLHAIATFHEDISITNFIRSWKGYLAKTAGIQWQTGFFDHRLRSDASFLEKAEYIRQNPVRAGLVESSEDWPHLFQG